METQKQVPQQESKKPRSTYTKSNLKVVVWENKGKDDKTFTNYNLEKFYKDSNGDWATTGSFSKQDLYKLRSLLDEVLSFEDTTKRE